MHVEFDPQSIPWKNTLIKKKIRAVSSPLLLTAAEIADYTGCKRRKDQIAVLKAKGVKHEVNKRGGIIVARGHVEYRLGVGQAPTPEPDFSIFHKTA